MGNLSKKILGLILAAIPSLVAAESLRNNLLIEGNPDVARTEITEKDIMMTAESWLIRVFAIVAVAVFIWTGRGILTASGDSDEFKKSLKSLLYAAIGLAVVPLAYVAIKLVISFNL